MGDMLSIQGLFGGTKVKKTAARDYGAEIRGIAQAQQDIAPGILATEQELEPQYAALNLKNLTTTLQGTDGQPGSIELFMNALRQSDPNNQALIDKLTSTASSDLDLGADLDPALLRQAQQSVRSRHSGTISGTGPAGDFQEALGISSFANDLRNQRRGFATTIAGLNTQRTGGIPALATGAATAAGVGPKIINPESAYASQLNAQNSSNTQQTNVSNAQNATQLWSGIFSMI